MEVVRRALAAPLKQIAVNAGLEGGVVVEKARTGPGCWSACDVDAAWLPDEDCCTLLLPRSVAARKPGQLARIKRQLDTHRIRGCSEVVRAVCGFPARWSTWRWMVTVARQPHANRVQAVAYTRSANSAI
ncbi:hypothetical protein AQJ91_29165 [Streptomyces dysideae]|uniref:Uncharacterized protein n=1 Tax=Streptomyces dysideae TaxID=909626 RepID=A0A101UVU9_9ACTN|nr:hypothetical protein AQJ91_29165 [Streptomyces dysideae]